VEIATVDIVVALHERRPTFGKFRDLFHILHLGDFGMLQQDDRFRIGTTRFELPLRTLTIQQAGLDSIERVTGFHRFDRPRQILQHEVTWALEMVAAAAHDRPRQG